ncbi:MAG: sulfotransferase domain-containing protein [Hydrococcus sp. Prado102]|jgi:hypothetical protein|nr:sulfotransferase domain-containing protein [Hydrococcus sp. Prado102]
MSRLFLDIKRKIVKKNNNLFTDKKNKFLILHCCHHKVGTAWFNNVLQGIAKEYELNYQHSSQDELKTNTDIFLQNHSIIDFSKLPPYKGSHMIRDPRDVIISGYFYHLWTQEEWAHIPKKQYNGMSYQEYLNSLDRENGIIAEIERFAGFDFKHMIKWNYENPQIIEIKYEDIIQNEQKIFYEIFKHYGFSEDTIKVSLKIAEKYSFKNVAKRNTGEINNKSHLRSGRSGEWKDYFKEDHKIFFKQILGDALIRLGYETNNDW